MVAKCRFGSNLANTVFTMSPGEENYRTKLQRTVSPDISTAVPVLAPSFSRPASSVFTFTAPKNEQSHLNHLVPGSRKGISRIRCRLCNRPKVTKISSTTRESWPLLSRDDITGQLNPFSTSSLSFKQSEPNKFLVNSNANAKLIDGLKPQYIPATTGSTATACSNLFSMSLVPPDNQTCHPVKKLEDADQIVKKASEMVKLLESHIAALQLSTQALKTPGESMIAVPGSPLNSNSTHRNEEPVNHFKQATHKLMETSMPLLTPLYPSSLPANSFNQQSPSFLNFSPATTFPCQTPSHTPSLSYSPSRPQSPVITCPCQTPSPAPKPKLHSNSATKPCHYMFVSDTKSCTNPESHTMSASKTHPKSDPQGKPMHRQSSIPSQKTSGTPNLNTMNIVQQLQSLSMSPNQYVQAPNPTPKYINEFTFPPLRTHSKLDKDNMYRTPTKAGSVVSSSSGVNRHKQSHTPGQTRISALTRKGRPPTSKLIRSHRLPPRQQHSSDYDDDSGSSASSSTSWTTADQSGSGSESVPDETDAYTYSSSAESSRTPESDYSTETASSSATSQINRPRLSISIPHSFNRRRSKKKPSASNEKPISRLRKIKNKLGLIFHHHHHHHHHHHDDEKPKPSRTKLPLVRQEAAAVKRRDQQGHFRALLKGLVRHVRSNKKKKSEPLNEIRRMKKKVQLGKVTKRRRGLKLPKFNKKSKFKAVRK